MSAESSTPPVSPAARFSGALTALVTPFQNGDIEWDDLRRLVEFQISKGITGLVSVGTTGESPTLTTEEHLKVIARTVAFAAGRVPVLAGTGSNSTEEALELTREAEKRGADGFLLVAPYYNKPSQEGLFRHFAKIAAATEKPVILYSIKGRCGIEIEVETVVRLRKECPNIAGVKDADGSVEKTSRLVRALDKDAIVLCGDDSLSLPFISVGAKGVISVASNWLPGVIVRLVRHALAGDAAAALALHNRYADVFRQIFIEPNPVPIKYLLAKAGLISSPEVRLPLCEPSVKNQATLDELFAGIPATA
ncbi:MAG: 4-hydroxy-tetrahydrodipicolinate synthase [Puniceicoccales bacterium]|jgi:4-hydroxy-tetrahydrodipicolinate synthase|nr:4-hydroxy-tetrahydrodipicolinate synthase [Puniceicoccales bacterium]